MSWTVRRWRALGSLPVVACLAAGCGDGPTLVPQSDEPLVLFILSVDAPVAPDTALGGLLLTTGSPLRADYRSAERLELRRAGDGAAYALRMRPKSGQAPIRLGASELTGNGNLVLANTTGTDGLGRADLVPGATYELVIESLGQTITGRATLPARPMPRRFERDGRRFVTWSPARGAAGYVVNVGIHRRVFTDTLYEIPTGGFGGVGQEMPTVRVSAVDDNLLRFLSDTTLGRAGLTGAYGVFGGMAVAELPGSDDDRAAASTGVWIPDFE
jgi:hypothetical protein